MSRWPNPLAGLIADSAGNLYGTTSAGGASNSGVVFKLSPDGTSYSVLYSFTGAVPQGPLPVAGLVADSAGNLYGTTVFGGGSGCSGSGCGVVFKLSPGGTETVLYSFTGGSDGANPEAGLIADSAGNLYGTTRYGGTLACGAMGSGCGVVFKLSPGGTETVLHSFTGGSDGAFPFDSPIEDNGGNLYGTTAGGGASNLGTVFKLSPGGIETVLYSFCSKPSCSDGRVPGAPLIADSKGNLYGTTQFGGAGGCSSSQFGCGTVFELTGAGFGGSVGDTHLTTFGGFLYDFQASGDLLLAQAGPDFVVQTRQASGAPMWPNAAVNKAVATQMGKTRVAICLPPTRIEIDGKTTDLGDGKSLSLPDGVDVKRRGNVYVITGQRGDFVRAEVYASWINVSVGLGGPAKVRGILANANGDVNEIETRDGIVLTNPFSFEDLYHRYADSWRVPSNESLLRVCGDREIESGIPTKTFYANDLDPKLYERARAVCNAAGVKVAPLLDACTLDVTVIGSDTAAQVFVGAPAPIAVGGIVNTPDNSWKWLWLVLALVIAIILGTFLISKMRTTP